MNDIFQMLLILTAGFALGILFFGGLWLTVQKSMTARLPALWFIGSFVLRTAVVLTGFYYVARGSWQQMLVCVAGFIISRMAVVAFTKTAKQKSIRVKEN